MDRECTDLCEKLARSIVARDYNGVHALLAPWLQAQLSPSDIQRMIDAASEGLEHPARSWTLDEGMVGLEELREPDGYGPPSQSISREINANNYRGWLSILFEPDPSVHEEQNVCFELWLAAVEHNGVLKAGYLEAVEPS